MSSSWGRDHGNLKCDGCGIKYDKFRLGMSFDDARKAIIAIQTDGRTGRTKYGREYGVLGYLHEMKLLAWADHVQRCTNGEQTGPRRPRPDGGRGRGTYRKKHSKRKAEWLARRKQGGRR